jgi:16S rRNA (guanine527-N7)-methyltransferase
MDRIDEAYFTDRLLALAGELDVPLSMPQAQACCAHFRLMLEWNLRLNLTRITDVNEVLVKHFLDSMVPVSMLPHSGFALDVGTGPGFPGVPLKILHPDLHMVLLETARKKVSFLKVLLSSLPCDNMWAVQGRWEEFRFIAHPLAKRRYRLITMRAVRLQREHLEALAAEILEPGGVFAWWAGPCAIVKQEALNPSLRDIGLVFEGEHSYSLPSISQHRRLLIWKKVT